MIKPAYFPLITSVASDIATLVLVYLGQILLILLLLLKVAVAKYCCQGNQTGELVLLSLQKT